MLTNSLRRATSCAVQEFVARYQCAANFKSRFTRPLHGSISTLSRRRTKYAPS